MATKKDEKAKKVRRPQAAKRMLQNENRRLRNKSFMSRLKTAVKTFETARDQKSNDAAVLLNSVYSLFDKGVKKGIVTANLANRNKSKLAASVAR